MKNDVILTDADKRTRIGVAYHMQMNSFLPLTDTGTRTGVAWPLQSSYFMMFIVSLLTEIVTKKCLKFLCYAFKFCVKECVKYAF